MSASLANFLKDFGSPPEPAPFEASEPHTADFSFDEEMLPLPMPTVDLEAERRELMMRAAGPRRRRRTPATRPRSTN